VVHPLRELLNRLRWDDRVEEAEVTLTLRVRHGEVEAAEEVAFSAVDEILAGGVTLAGGMFIPYHRVLCAERNGVALWQVRARNGAGNES
jgi:uncharacterized protein (UPF0248 family)